jgi:hypothetical protein
LQYQRLKSHKYKVQCGIIVDYKYRIQTHCIKRIHNQSTWKKALNQRRLFFSWMPYLLPRCLSILPRANCMDNGALSGASSGLPMSLLYWSSTLLSLLSLISPGPIARRMRREVSEERINGTTSCELHGCRSHYTAAWILRHQTWLGAQLAPSRAIVIASIKDDERVIADACHELIEVARLPTATDLYND